MALPNDPTTTPNLPQADTTSNTWDTSTISNIIFSVIMVFIGIIAIWQAHQSHRRSNRILDQEELIGIQLLSRASSTLSNSSHTVHPNPSMAPSGQTASSCSRPTTGPPLPHGETEAVDRVNIPSDAAVAS